MKRLTEIIKIKDSKKKSIQFLEESLHSFSEIVQVPITFYTPEGELLWEVNSLCKLCNASTAYGNPESSCMMNRKAAMKTAYGLGEVYIYVCEAGLINMCYAFEFEEKLHGYFNVGPIAMGKSMERVIGSIPERVPIETLDLSKLLSISTKMKAHSPKEVAAISTLFVNAVYSVHFQMETRNLRYQQSEEQNMIGMKIIELKKSRIEIKYPFEQEEMLIKSLKMENVNTCKKLFSKYLGELMVFEGGNMTVIKLRLMTLFSKLLTHESDWMQEHLGMTHLERINNASTITEVISNSNDMIEFISKNFSSKVYTGNHMMINQAIEYIHKNYMESISLKGIADSIHINSSYLSTLFKKEMGKSIVDYINDVRLENAAEDLQRTKDAITEIALSNGFKDVSYFTKLFRKKYGATPRQYRQEEKL